MIDIKFLRENPEVVKENIRKKFQDEKLPLVDEKKIAFNPAVEISYLKPNEQQDFLEAMDYAQSLSLIHISVN